MNLDVVGTTTRMISNISSATVNRLIARPACNAHGDVFVSNPQRASIIDCLNPAKAINKPGYDFVKFVEKTDISALYAITRGIKSRVEYLNALLNNGIKNKVVSDVIKDKISKISLDELKFLYTHVDKIEKNTLQRKELNSVIDAVNDNGLDKVLGAYLDLIPSKLYNLIDRIDCVINLAEIDLAAQNKISNITGDIQEYAKIKIEMPAAKTSDDVTKIALQKEKDAYLQMVENIAQILPGQTPTKYEAFLYQNERELAPLKAFLKNYSKDDSELSKYLYEAYYLPRLSPETKIICKKIANEFDIKLFVENENSPKTAQKVYDELSEWRRASKGKFFSKSIPTINLSRYEAHYAKRRVCGGFHSPDNSSIHVKSEELIDSILRHEITHSFARSKNDIDFSKFVARGPQKAANVPGDILLGGCMYKDELFNAGLNLNLIKYAYTNPNEFMAVASQGDYSKYSPEFKNVLVKMGMPEWIFDMKPSNQKFVNSAKI